MTINKFFLFSFLLILVTPMIADAQYRNRGGWDINRSSLDDDVVEQLPIPVLFAVEYDDVIPDFGDPRGGGTREHEGQDFIAPQGTPIVSPTEAIVIRTGTGASAGKYVYTANPGGETFRYMHLDYIADLDRGDKLAVGDFIGTVGDTGNAVPGSYHLHFETRDDDNQAQDPYPRLTEEFTLREQISFLDDIFRDIRNDEEYAEFLVNEFPGVFREALAKDYDMPRAIEEALEEGGYVRAAEGRARLAKLLGLLPGLIATELENGDQNNAVVLLQIYLIYTQEGAARDRLAAAGPTGYFGSITAAALSEYQASNNLPLTGRYDAATRSDMLKTEVALQL